MSKAPDYTLRPCRREDMSDMSVELCAHKQVVFDFQQACGLSAQEVRRRWPRFHGLCRCGYSGVAYASVEHYIAGDW